MSREPVMLGFVLVAFVVVLAAFAFGLTEAQIAAAVVAVGGVTALVVRSKVTPTG